MDPLQVETIARRHGILLLLQFGSTVAGRARSDSDLDLAVPVERVPATLREQSDLYADLQSAIPDRQVDVSLINPADPLFLKKIVERCTLLHGSPRRLHELKMYAFKRYQDHRKYLDMEREYVRRAVRSASP